MYIGPNSYLILVYATNSQNLRTCALCIHMTTTNKYALTLISQKYIQICTCVLDINNVMQGNRCQTLIFLYICIRSATDAFKVEKSGNCSDFQFFYRGDNNNVPPLKNHSFQ